MHLAPGRKIDRYIIGAPIGEGASAVVYAAKHEALGTEHAIKVLTQATPQVTRRLLAEGRAQAHLRHPNIVNVTDVVEIDGQPGLVMEHVRGPTLAELIARGRLAPERVDALVRPLLEGVEYAHAKGVLHRDLKPGNVLLSLTPAGPVPKILDFGLVKFLSAEMPGSIYQETLGGMPLGTPYYMAPEQFDPSIEITGATDVWSLGVLLYELVTGQRPFAGQDILALAGQIRRGEYIPLPELAPGVPDRWERAIRGALQVDTSKRWRSPGELLSAWQGDIVRRATLPPEPSAETEDPWTAELKALYMGRSTDPPPQPLDASAETIDPSIEWKHVLDTSEVPKDLPSTTPTPLAPRSQRNPVPWILAAASVVLLVAAGLLAMRGDTPAPVEAPEPAPAERPPPASSAVPAATLTVQGVEPEFVRLRDERGLYPASQPVPPGVYEVLLRDDHGEEHVALRDYALVSGQAYTLKCKAKTWTCR
ncbi:MAG: serine/threonine protein kinase [Deltaproteobacteria bacterium]|nr:MAG: serine/threonine protein kinase [Deltaproteobacteria bacterium]